MFEAGADKGDGLREEDGEGLGDELGEGDELGLEPDCAAEKIATIVWVAATLVNVYKATFPTDLPSTKTDATRFLAQGVMVKVCEAPPVTETEPDGLIVPPPSVWRWHTAKSPANQSRVTFLRLSRSQAIAPRPSRSMLD